MAKAPESRSAPVVPPVVSLPSSGYKPELTPSSVAAPMPAPSVPGTERPVPNQVHSVPEMTTGGLFPQVMLPAVPASAPNLLLPPWLADAERYLDAAGWQKLGCSERGDVLWRDPNATTSKTNTYVAIELPAQGGGKELVKQLVLPPVVWDYNTVEATSMQRQRDLAGEALPDLIRRKEAELGELRARLASAAGAGAGD